LSGVTDSRREVKRAYRKETDTLPGSTDEHKGVALPADSPTTAKPMPAQRETSERAIWCQQKKGGRDPRRPGARTKRNERHDDGRCFGEVGYSGWP
jgi:hypothetical protein